MIKHQEIYEPGRPGAPFIAAVFDPDDPVVASQGFSTRAGAEAFLQAFMQEDAGEYGLHGDPQESPGR